MILLARNGPADRQKALVFMEQAAEVVRDTAGSVGNEGVNTNPFLRIHGFTVLL